MDPATAFALAAKAIAEMVTEIMHGQTLDQKAKIWDWYVKDVERWRKIFKLDEQVDTRTFNDTLPKERE